jgi:hypothetical protein
MKVFAHLCVTALLFVSSLSLALPKVSVDVLSEVKSVDQVLDDLITYESRFWAIGLNGDTLQPDAFHRFFAARDMKFQFFVRSMSGVVLGDISAYQENRLVLLDYRRRLIEEEIAQAELIVQQIMTAQKQDAAVGLTADTVQPDNLITFFGERGLEIRYYVRGPSFTLGDSSAYEHNLQVVRAYIQQLKDLGATPDQ